MAGEGRASQSEERFVKAEKYERLVVWWSDSRAMTAGDPVKRGD